MINLTAKDIMNPQILSVRVDWLIDQLSDFLCENCISGAPVISENDKFVGVVSMTDIVRYKSLPLDNPQPGHPHEYYLHAPDRYYSPEEIESLRVEAESLTTIRDIMTPMTYSVDEDTNIQEVAKAMITGQIHRVFVTRKDKLAGIITTIDMLKVIRDL